jgi:hypothetical protein
MKTTPALITLCLLASLPAVPALAEENRCQTMTGKAVWTVIPAPNDQLGRVLGQSTGDLKASVSAFLTGVTPQANGSLTATSIDVWVMGPQDTLVFDGAVTFTPLPGAPVGTVADSLALTVTGGTGAYAGATGSLQVTGTGYNFFGPNAGPGGTYAEVTYRGAICRVR